MLLGFIVIPSGCVKEDFDTTPPFTNIATWTKTATIAQVKALYKADQTEPGIVSALAAGSLGDSIIIEGTVISNDSASNFYETVTILDETGGIDIKINASELYLSCGLKPGQKVLVKVNDLALDKYHESYQLGFASTDYDFDINKAIIDVTGVNVSDFSKYIQRSGNRIAPEPTTLKISEITTSNTQTLVKIEGLQFRNAGEKFCEPGETTNRVLIDSEGKAILLRTSGFAKFANEILPSGNGSVTGVLGIYDETYQLFIRDLNDIQFNNDAFTDDAPAVNSTIVQLKALCTSNLVQITQNVVIEAVINANDVSGNIYKQLFIQDQSGAIEFDVNVIDTYKQFPVGKKIIINCKGLYLGKYGNVIKLGGMYIDNGTQKIGRLNETQFRQNVYPLEANLETIVPVVTTVEGFNDNLINKVVTLHGVQFVDTELGKTFAESSTTNRNIENQYGKKVIVRNSNYSDFAMEQLPSGSGTITAVLSKFNSDYQLFIREYKEVDMQDARFTTSIPTPNSTIAELKALFTTSPMQITSDVIIEAVVEGNDISGNLYKQLFITDATGSIEFKVNVTNLYQNYPAGTKIIVNCTGMYLGTYGGVIQLGGLYNGNVGMIEATEFNNKVYINGTSTVTPTETTITGITDAMIGKLIKLSGVQFIDSDLTKVYAESSTSYTNRTLKDASNNTIIVRTSKYANFASTVLPGNSGAITAILSQYNGTYQLYIVKVSDVVFDQPRF
jgi:hypothetical protein